MIVSARVSITESEALKRLALLNERSPSREVRRAIRFYIDHYELVDRALRAQVARAGDVSDG
jgi:hypothetical protein